MKIGVVVITHGQLATELLNAAEMIVGDLPTFAAVSIGWHEDVDQARDAIAPALARTPREQDLLALAREMRDHGRSAIWVASDLLRGEKG
jgi:PTS system mannose-specific IIA component